MAKGQLRSTKEKKKPKAEWNKKKKGGSTPSPHAMGRRAGARLFAYFIVGMTNSAPSLMPEGQRAVTVLVLV